MALKYVTRCNVKKDGKKYIRGSIIEGLTPDEIKQGLKEQWLDEVGNEDSPVTASTAPKDKPTKPKPAKNVDQMNKAELFTRAAELGIEVKEGVTPAELRQEIKEAQEKAMKADLLATAAERGITDVNESMTIAELRKKIEETKTA